MRKIAIMMAGAMLATSFAATSYAASGSYEQINIARVNLNGNAVWGVDETMTTVRQMGGLDCCAAFYSKSHNVTGSLPTELTVGGVPYKFQYTGGTAFTGNDCIRLYRGAETQTMELETIGAYSNIYVLGTAGGPGTGNYANFRVTLNYTDGTSKDDNYRLYDWYDMSSQSGVTLYKNVQRYMLGNTSYTDGSLYSGPALQSRAIATDPTKLLKSITFKLTGRNGGSNTSGLYCGVFAVTGMASEAAPATVTASASDITTTGFTANWTESTGATSYAVDVSTTSNFTSFVGGYNNYNVGNVTSKDIELGAGTYYLRVRAINSVGSSISSNIVEVKINAGVIEVTPADNQDLYPSVQSVKEGSKGTIRFIWQINYADSVINNFGAYIIPFDQLTEGEKNIVKYDNDDIQLESGKTFSADISNIYHNTTTVYAVPFVNDTLYEAQSLTTTVEASDINK